MQHKFCYSYYYALSYFYFGNNYALGFETTVPNMLRGRKQEVQCIRGCTKNYSWMTLKKNLEK